MICACLLLTKFYSGLRSLSNMISASDMKRCLRWVWKSWQSSQAWFWPDRLEKKSSNLSQNLKNIIIVSCGQEINCIPRVHKNTCLSFKMRTCSSRWISRRGNARVLLFRVPETETLRSRWIRPNPVCELSLLERIENEIRFRIRVKFKIGSGFCGWIGLFLLPWVFIARNKRFLLASRSLAEGGVLQEKKYSNKAPCEDWTHDPQFTRLVLCHWAKEAP